MMTCFLTCMFTLLPMCVMASKAMLSPPKHLTVGLLDFKATAEWLPGQGNPPGSRFTVEFITAQNMCLGKWIRSPNCTNTDVLKCELTFDPQLYDLHWNYFVRVKTTFKGTSSNWTTTLNSFQPYGDSRLSSPDVQISTYRKSITINFTHRLELNPGMKPLKYHLYLFENTSEEESKSVAETSTSESSHIFKDLPSDMNYCVSVSASHQLASKNNCNTTKCIFLLDPTGSFALLVCIVAMLLITLSTGIVLTFVCSHHLKPTIKNLRIPKSLINISVTNWVLKLMPDEINILIWQKQVTNDSTSTSDMDSKDGSSFYCQRENLTNAIMNSSSTASVSPPEQAEAGETSNQYCKYTLATDMEERDGSVSEKGDDSMHSGSFEFLSACALNNVRLSEELPTISVNMNSMRDSDCVEETVSCSSGNDCERELPSEEEEEDEEDIFLLPDYSESGYEPR